jgi:hypothetical protein
MPVREGGHLMAAEAAVAGQNEAAAAGPAHEHGHQLPQQARGGLVTSVVLATPLGRPIQGHEHGQSPGSSGEGELDQDRQDDPFVSPPPGGVGLGRADGVAVASLAVDRVAAVLVDGVVSGQRDRLVMGKAAEDDARQDTGQRPEGPASPREDAVVTGGMAGGQAADGAQQVGDGAAAVGQHGTGHEDGESLEGRPCEGVGEGPDQRAQEVGYNSHEGLLAGRR